MNQPVVAQDLESLIQDIDEALGWLEAMGIEARRGRFGEYRRNLVTVLEHRRAGTLDKLPAIVPREHYRIAFIESTHLVAIAKSFRHIRGPRFREKVRDAAAGPAHPLNEKQSGSKARDLLFELSVAAFFRRRRLPVLIPRGKDLTVRMSGSTFLIECKRPQSAKKVRRSIEDATKQLMRHFQCYGKATARYGVIALDISVVANPQRDYLIADSVVAFVNGVNALFDRFHAEFKSALAYQRDPRILGILLFAKILGYHTQENRHINCEKFGICVHAQAGTYRASVADMFYNALLR
jgi:hypothetical protein